MIALLGLCQFLGGPPGHWKALDKCSRNKWRIQFDRACWDGAVWRGCSSFQWFSGGEPSLLGPSGTMLLVYVTAARGRHEHVLRLMWLNHGTNKVVKRNLNLNQARNYSKQSNKKGINLKKHDPSIYQPQNQPSLFQLIQKTTQSVISSTAMWIEHSIYYGGMQTPRQLATFVYLCYFFFV